MASRDVRIQYVVDLVDKAARRMLAEDRKIRSSAQQTGKVQAREAKDASRQIVQASRTSTAAMGRQAKQSEQAAHRQRTSFGSVAKSAAKAAIGIGGAYLGYSAAKGAISNTEDLAKTTLALHRNTGLSVKSSSEWAAVAKVRNIESKALSMAFGTLSKNTSAAASGGKQQAEAFKKLGISHKDVARGSKDMDFLLRRVADGFGKMKGSPERTALGMRLLGRGWQTVLPLFKQGSKSMDEQLKLADKYGVTFGGKTVKSVGQLVAAQREAKFATLGLQVAFATKLAPTLTKIIGKAAEFVAEMRSGKGAGGRFADTAGEIADQAGSVARTFGNAAKKIGAFAEKHPGLVKVATTVATIGVGVKAISFGSKILGVTRLIGLFGKLKTAAAGAAVAQGAAGGAGAAKGIGAGGIAGRVLATAAGGTAGAVGGIAAVGYIGMKAATASTDKLSKATVKQAAVLHKASASAAEYQRKLERLAKQYDRLGHGSSAMNADARRAAAALRKMKQPLDDIDSAIGRLARSGKQDMGNLAASVRMNSGLIGRALDSGALSSDEAKEKLAANFNAAAAALGRIGGKTKEMNEYLRKALALFKITGDAARHYLDGLDTTGKPLTGPGGHRRGGLIFGAGGMVPARVSPGELVAHAGGAWVVPGARTAADSVSAMLPVGAQVYTSDGQNRLAAGQSPASVLTSQAPHFAKGGTVSPARIRGLAEHVGVRGQASKLATAIALAESGGNPKAVSSTGDYGLWQINKAAHPSYSTDRLLSDNAYNARAMFAISEHGRNWNPWTTYKSGAYRSQLGKVPKAAADVRRAPPGGRITSSAEIPADAFSQGYQAGLSGTGLGALLADLTEETTTTSTSKKGRRSPHQSSSTSDAAVKAGTAVIDGKPVANWIAPYITWAKSHGWSGTVSSGFRSLAEQKRIYDSGVRPAAKPGTSNHEGDKFPRGAVDVTLAGKLSEVLKGRPGPKHLLFAGAKDPVHFSWPHGGSYRRGGIAQRFQGGGTQMPTAAGAVGAFTSLGSGASTQSAVKGLAAALAGVDVAAYTRLERLRRAMLHAITELEKGGIHGAEKTRVRGLRQAVAVVEATMGRTLGAVAKAVEDDVAGLDRQRTAIERHMRTTGIDEASSAGIQALQAFTVASQQVLARDAARLQDAVVKARREGDAETTSDLEGKLADIRDALAETAAVYAEQARAIIMAAAQEQLDVATHVASLAQTYISGLSAQQRLAGTADTSEGQLAQASAITSTLIPALEAEQQKLRDKLAAAVATGNAEEIRATDEALASLSVDITTAMADAADLIKQAQLQAAAKIVAAAQHQVTMLQTVMSGIQAGQTLTGTAGTPGAMQQQAAFITGSIVPALTDSLHGLLGQLQTAMANGEEELVASTQESIASTGVEIISALADAAELIKQAQLEAAKRIVDAAQHQVTMAQGALAFLQAQQNLAQIGDTPAAAQAQAAFILANVIPALQGQLQALNSQLATALQVADTDLVNQTLEGIQSLQTEILNGMAQAADLIRQAAEKVAQMAVDAAKHGSTMADLGFTRLELEQKLAGTFDTRGGGQSRGDYINKVIIPAINAEIAALKAQLQAAGENQELRTQIEEALAGENNSLLQAMLEALGQIEGTTADTAEATKETAENTKTFGGTVGFERNGQTLNDSLSSIGSGW